MFNLGLYFLTLDLTNTKVLLTLALKIHSLEAIAKNAFDIQNVSACFPVKIPSNDNFFPRHKCFHFTRSLPSTEGNYGPLN